MDFNNKYFMSNNSYMLLQFFDDNVSGQQSVRPICLAGPKPFGFTHRHLGYGLYAAFTSHKKLQKQTKGKFLFVRIRY